MKGAVPWRKDPPTVDEVRALEAANVDRINGRDSVAYVWHRWTSERAGAPWHVWIEAGVVRCDEDDRPIGKIEGEWALCVPPVDANSVGKRQLPSASEPQGRTRRGTELGGVLGEVQAGIWLEALERHQGKVARAAKEFGFSRQRGHILTKRHGLLQRAAQLRAGAPAKAVSPQSSPTAAPAPSTPSTAKASRRVKKTSTHG